MRVNRDSELNLEDFESGDIEYSDEVLSFVFRVEGLVDAGDQPREHLGVDSLRQSSHRIDDLQQNAN